MPLLSRRQFLALGAAGLAVAALPRRLHAAVPRALGPHPTPRAGITAAKVMTREQLAGEPELVPLFDAVRAIPQVLDGIRCNCGCADLEGFYSLLSCFEGPEAMAMHCVVCQGQGRLAARLQKEGKTLEQIRVAVDAKFG